MRRILHLLFLSSFACACSSTEEGSNEETFVGPPTEMRWFLYKSGQTISLVNESHTDRLELYSEVREKAGPKVVSDDVMDGLVEYFEKQGFDEHAKDGPAPATGSPQLTQALEVRADDHVSHMLLGPGSTEEERQSFQECSSAFMEVWNLTYQAQAVENERGKAIFDQPGTTIHYKKAR